MFETQKHGLSYRHVICCYTYQEKQQKREKYMTKTAIFELQTSSYKIILVILTIV